MPSSQPANTTITVDRRTRVQIYNQRHTSIKHLTTPFGHTHAIPPGEESLVLETRDAVVTDAFRYGHPVVVYPRTICTLPVVYAAVTGMDFPVRLPGNWREIQLQKDAAHRTEDLYGNLRAACPGGAYV